MPEQVFWRVNTRPLSFLFATADFHAMAVSTVSQGAMSLVGVVRRLTTAHRLVRWAIFANGNRVGCRQICLAIASMQPGAPHCGVLYKDQECSCKRSVTTCNCIPLLIAVMPNSRTPKLMY